MAVEEAAAMNRKLIAFVLLMAGSQCLLAETLSGTISDEGAPVPLAEVTLIDATNNLIVTTTHSNIRGAYQLTVSPGRYKLRSSKEDYADRLIKDIVVSGADVVVDITMSPQAFEDDKAVPASGDCD